jgi:hypothetical protein
MGRFPGLADVRANRGSMWFLDGDYLVRIEKTFLKHGRDGKDSFIVSAEVVESTNSARPPGCKPSQVAKIDPRWPQIALSDFKNHVAAVLEIKNPDDYHVPLEEMRAGETQEAADNRFWDEAFELVLSDEQPTAGMLIRLHCYTRITTKSEKPITVHQWGEVVQEAESSPSAPPAPPDDISF